MRKTVTTKSRSGDNDGNSRQSDDWTAGGDEEDIFSEITILSEHSQVVLCPYFENVPSRSMFVIANVTVMFRRAIYS